MSQAWLLIHTDDLDANGTDQEVLDYIFETLDEPWSIKKTEPNFMLGINRKVSKDEKGNVTSCEHTMEAYTIGLAETFRSDLPKKTLSTIFPSKSNKASDEETKTNLGRGLCAL